MERERESYPKWPWTDLVSKVSRCTELSSDSNVLELGCGAGANIPFFLDLEVNYFSIEGAKSAVEKVHKRFPALESRIVQGDFTEDLPFNDKKFDLVVDRASITTNSTKDIKLILKNISDTLVEGGKLISIDMYSIDHSEFGKGSIKVDEFTEKGFKSGDFSGLGEIHFSSLGHLQSLFEPHFEIELIEKKSKSAKFLKSTYKFSAWDIVSKKT